MKIHFLHILFYENTYKNNYLCNALKYGIVKQTRAKSQK